ncbi:hypothetical protein BDZ88DRAFT_296743 [Geranomyces variabilis]|nr:hypothetical protein BDZ88DRAFT_296743 [Geranomyces variabilis]
MLRPRTSRRLNSAVFLMSRCLASCSILRYLLIRKESEYPMAAGREERERKHIPASEPTIQRASSASDNKPRRNYRRRVSLAG